VRLEEEVEGKIAEQEAIARKKGGRESDLEGGRNRVSRLGTNHVKARGTRGLKIRARIKAEEAWSGKGGKQPRV